MDLFAIAAADNAKFLQDRKGGFAREVTIQNPAGQTAKVNAVCTDIADYIDTETGALVSARFASVTFSRSALTAAGLGLPVCVNSGKPWRLSFAGADGVLKTFTVAETPSDDLGTYTCNLKVIAQ